MRGTSPSARALSSAWLACGRALELTAGTLFFSASDASSSRGERQRMRARSAHLAFAARDAFWPRLTCLCVSFACRDAEEATPASSHASLSLNESRA